MLEPQDMMDGAPNLERRDSFIEAAGTDTCGMCHAKELQALPCVRLCCKHVFHADCVERQLDMKRPTLRLTADKYQCPTCKVQLELNAKQCPPELLKKYKKAVAD